MRILKVLYSLGMIGVTFYLTHTILGNLLWEEYNPITTDISSLTAVGAPNAVLLRNITLVYSVCMIIFSITLIFTAFKQYHRLLKVGFIIFLVMQLTSSIGYGMFPLGEDKTQMNFQNMMHIIVTVIVVFTTIASVFLIAFGYLKQEKKLKIGKFSLTMAILITIFGMFNPISMGLEMNILGLTERLVIYSIQFFVFVLSYYYTFLNDQGLEFNKQPQ